MTATSAGTVTLVGGNNITLSTGASVITISGPNTVAQSAQTGISGIRDAAQTITSGTVSLSGHNVTWSVNGQTITLSGPVSHAVQTGISAISNSDTTYTSGTVGLSALTNITIRSTTGNQFQFSGRDPQTAISGVRASDATYTSGTVIISGGNNITVSSGANQSINIHGPNTHAAQTGISGVVASDATYTSGTINIVGENNITIHSGANQSVLISGPTSHAQQTGISSIAGSNTTYTAGLVEFTGSGNVTVRSSANSRLVIDASNQNLSVGVSTGGNTNGNTTVNSGSQLVFSGQNNITISQATAAGATTLGFSGPVAGGAQTGISSIAASNTTYTSGQVIISGGNNITVSSGANQSINIHGPNSHAQQTGISAVVQGANTASSGTVELMNANGVSFSLNGQSISGSVTTQPTLSNHWLWAPYGVNNPAGAAMDQNTVNVVPMTAIHPVTASRFHMWFSQSISTSTNSSHAGRLTVQLGFYTRNVSTLSLASSGSATVNWTNTSNNSTANVSGIKRVDGTLAALNMTPGAYWVAYAISTSSVNANWFTMSYVGPTAMNANSGVFGAANAASNQVELGLGQWTATSASAPSSIALSDITGTNAGAQRHPFIAVNNFTV